jgi:hypothetical protein
MGRIGPPIQIIETPVVGFRDWRVYAAGYLRSLVTSECWAPGATFTAHCEQPDCPHLDCVCGVHAFRDLSHLASRQGTHVTGAVALWGRIVEHELGFRAQHARPVALGEGYYAQRVANIYGLPVLARESLAVESEDVAQRSISTSTCGGDGVRGTPVLVYERLIVTNEETES